jgi:hypothetical protein
VSTTHFSTPSLFLYGLSCIGYLGDELTLGVLGGAGGAGRDQPDMDGLYLGYNVTTHGLAAGFQKSKDGYGFVHSARMGTFGVQPSRGAKPQVSGNGPR